MLTWLKRWPIKKNSRNVDTQQKITDQSITFDIVSLVTTIHTKMSRLSPCLLVCVSSRCTGKLQPGCHYWVLGTSSNRPPHCGKCTKICLINAPLMCTDNFHHCNTTLFKKAKIWVFLWLKNGLGINWWGKKIVNCSSFFIF